ncbi:hypothetical protein [Sphingomonas sp.]|uniref:hypothetical protein n=1 Tax=Sphingomonas sp. TaxID=28214 RepID=UPI0025D884F3|nr:hypothetical protein [Sphingomonas sp.]
MSFNNALAALLVTISGAALAEPNPDTKPVKLAELYVTPYYDSGNSPFSDRRQVHVGKDFDPLLVSDRLEDVLKARDLVLAQPDLVTPMTMMVLAARLYDLGQRDDAVFWFYVAKNRYITLMDVIDIQSSGLSEPAQAMNSFHELLGPIINSYAFCNIANQQAIRRRAFDWAKAHAYQAIFLSQLTASEGGDRKVALERSYASIAEGMAKESAYLADPKNATEILETRRKNHVIEQFCW